MILRSILSEHCILEVVPIIHIYFCIKFIFGLRKYDHKSEFRVKLKWLATHSPSPESLPSYLTSSSILPLQSIWRNASSFSIARILELFDPLKTFSSKLQCIEPHSLEIFLCPSCPHMEFVGGLHKKIPLPSSVRSKNYICLNECNC